MHIPAAPPVGHLIAYEYLWRSKSGDREDGSKTYPAAVVLSRLDLGPAPMAYVLGMSPKPRLAQERAVEVPGKLKRWLGLDDQPSWIYTDQVNVFVWPGPDLRPASWLSGLPKARDTCVIGALPVDWLAVVTSHLAESHHLRRLASVRRSS